jgi:hypothetical protein
MRSLRILLPLFCVSLISLFMAVAASAEATVPVWKIMSVSTPTNFKPGDKSGDDALIVTATNVGGSSTGCTIASNMAREDGCHPEQENKLGTGPEPESPIVPSVMISDALPSGLHAIRVFGDNAYHDPVGGLGSGSEQEEVSGPPFGLSCAIAAGTPSCTTSERIDPGDTLVITIQVAVETESEGEGELNSASVSGGGAASADTSAPVTISSARPTYGVAKGGVMAATSTSQAGAHPNVTNEFFLNTINPEGEQGVRNGGVEPHELLQSESVAPSKDVRFDLPSGLVGSTVGMPRCTMADVIDESDCPQDTMVGAATLIVLSHQIKRAIITVPVYNIAPSPGEPAAFAFNALYFPARLDTSVLSSGEYNVRVNVPNITQGASDYMSSVTIWGVPAEHNAPGHDNAARTAGGGELTALWWKGHGEITFGGNGIEESSVRGAIVETVAEQRVPLLSNPSQCSESLSAVLETDSWEAPEFFGGDGTAKVPMGVVTGCNQLPFDPSVSMLPDTLEAGAPAGYTFNLRLPQNDEAEGLASADVKRTAVTLPAGTVISPSAADGLGDCSNEQFELKSGELGNCPRDSQVGEVRVKTPALEERMSGEVYLGSPECEPCSPRDAQEGKMVRLFLQFSSEGEGGIVVKLEGHGEINQQTGQITTVFENTPQLPFSELQLILTGGERATLANPRSCGTATTTSDLTPWSTPYTPDATPSSSFEIEPSSCFGSRFNPSFTAGTTSNQAGGYSPFTLSFGREDADEFLNGVQLQMPPGLLGMISRVKLCGEPQAAEGTCGAESQIGEVSVETGPGADPFLVTGGKVFITGPYKGAPYGLSIVVPAKAGPYTLSGTTGKGTVVVRSAIGVNPSNAALTVTSDPLPTELDGIPLQLRRVNVTVGTSNNFTFNPTSCEKMEVKGTLTSVANATANPASSFQVTNCAGLKFKPSFSAQTSAKTSKANGASLLFKLAYPANAVTSEAWFSKMKFDIPKQLPARLTTIQKACVAKVFEANPAACPAASNIGRAVVHTPILPVPVEGPVYFVSYGGQKFPEVVLVLQGDGVTVDLHGETNISKAGVTSAVFRSVPDVPFETAEVYVPTGPFSEFTALGNVCAQNLMMPVAFTPQNGGAEIHQNTKIGVIGCPRSKKAVKKKKKGKRARKASNNGRARS